MTVSHHLHVHPLRFAVPLFRLRTTVPQPPGQGQRIYRLANVSA
jgi:hypothetical protein